ncbi:MAG: NAD(P)-dependent oxidoreductase [Bacteroides sp.]|nr:NAD(P)-dependent oxidoreductase [Bacillota bacterium]MCM1394359.1 NAD(P)-dependent oxidoreductase [[Eubacterium] siraeum]MCM1456057.1 NAD(P)-dependent oxidoreductase [Bacteroides sp.]
MQKTVAITGASGNMGMETLRQIMELDCVKKVKILLLNERRERKYSRECKRKYKQRVQVIFGNLADKEKCRALVKDTDYVLHLAAVIPPLADHKPKETDDCNRIGTMNLVDSVVEIKENQPKFVHISTVAIYGNRNYKHPWGRVGDPLISSVYDDYSASKIKGERYVLDSALDCWVVLRQTGMLHSRMLTNNMKDGLMFHTCFNAPIEWVTARDSGLLLKNLIKKDAEQALSAEFWHKCYNIGGGACNRVTGYDTFDEGFKIIGGSTEKFMKPQWNSLRNFHCMWFEDSHVLNDYLDFQREDVKDYWQEILHTHRIYSVGKIIPPRVISKLAIERLLKDENAPRKWINSKDMGRVKAFFGSSDNISCMPTSWDNYPVLAKGQLADGSIDYDEMRDINLVEEHGYRLDHGYDESKPDSELDIEDMRDAATFRGGKCVSESMTKGDLYTKLEWECHDGHRFFASPYTVLKAGHWCPECCQPQPWDYDRLSKFMPFYAQVWYDTHAKGEDTVYYFDKDHNARYKKL